MNDFEFECKELENFQKKIHNDSVELINWIIKKYSPVQIGDIIEITEWDKSFKKLEITDINLHAINSYGHAGDRLSFDYAGLPLNKDGQVMKNRRRKYFGFFIKDGKQYHMPSYMRVEIKPARMYYD